MNQTLLYNISSPEKLLSAWGKLDKTNKSSHGLDNVSIQDFANNLEDKVSSISGKLRNDSYNFSANRAVLIPKSNGKFRPLQVPIISDRLVLKAIAIELEEQFKNIIDKSLGVSFAYQKHLGVKNAIYKIKEHYDNGFSFVLEADLINFFGEVDKERLLETQIFPNLSDNSLNDLIYSGLNQKLGGLDVIRKDQRKYFNDIQKGVPQGNPLSPLLSNIYLSPFDLLLKKEKLNLVRYADDFVILCEDESECLKAYGVCESVLNSLDLRLHPLKDADKTKIINLKKSSLNFLSITFDGKTFYPSIENVERFKAKIREICNGKIDHTVLSLLVKISNVLDGWISAFYYTEVEKYTDELDFFLNRQLFLALRKFNWKFSQKAKGILPAKYIHLGGGQSSDCLSQIQRKKSGIPYCQELLNQKRKVS